MAGEKKTPWWLKAVGQAMAGWLLVFGLFFQAWRSWESALWAGLSAFFAFTLAVGSLRYNDPDK